MKAAVYTGFKQMAYAEVPDARIVHEEDAVVRVLATTICGSDLHFYHGFVRELQRGSIIGHEAVGEVVEVGPAVHKLRVGDKIVVPFNVACGRCHPCRTGLESQCDEANPYGSAGAFFGCSRLFGAYEGCQAEYVRVPYANYTSFRVPEDNELEDGQLLLLSDLLPTSYWGVDHAGVKPDDTVLVLGCGPVGLMCQRFARLRGARRVLAVDPVAERVEMARRWNGSEGYVLKEPAELSKELYDATNGGASVVIDCVGGDGLMTPGEMAQTMFHLQGGGMTAFNMASQTVAKGGTIQLVGVYSLGYNDFPLGDLFSRNISLRMGYAPVIHNMEMLYRQLHGGQLGAADLVTHRLPLSEAATAYRLFDRKEHGCLKVMLKP